MSTSSKSILVRLLRSENPWMLIWPQLDLVVRLWLAQIFFVSGVMKLTHWETALSLATFEYPVPWMAPATAALLGMCVEVGGAVLLAAGFMTRYAAAAMLALSLVIQFEYLPFDSQLFWAALFGWFAIAGAGSLSIDRLLRRGLIDSALPLIPHLLRGTEWVRSRVAPVYLSLMRVWFGGSLVVAALGAAPALALWLPLHAAKSVPAGVAVACGALLVIGLGTRLAALIALLAVSAGTMMDPRLSDAIYLLMFFAVFAVRGAGGIAVDRIIVPWLAGLLTAGDSIDARAAAALPRVVIVGAGFGGIACAAALRNGRARITLVDRANHHVFQPLLYQVATAALSPGDIAAPVRPLFRDSAAVRVLLSEVTGVDAGRKVVLLGEKELPYDYLVLATGASHSYFGKDQWAPFAPGLKRVEDAIEIRRRILTAFERAEATDDAGERASLLTFLIVGGGPTGVELAGAIAELARFGMEKEFHSFDPADARVILVQSAPRLLPAFPESLAVIARQSLERLGVEVLVGSRVENIDAEGVSVSGKRILSRTVLWAAGVMASPAAQWLKAPADNAGRLKVGSDLSVPGMADVYAIGDTAGSNAWNGQPVPGLAPAAKQGGVYVARQILHKIDSRVPLPPFVYRHLGSLATIGRKAAVVDFGVVKLWGAPAWWLWGLVHIGFLVGLRNRVTTMINWFWAYLTFGGGIRLITGGDTRARP